MARVQPQRHGGKIPKAPPPQKRADDILDTFILIRSNKMQQYEGITAKLLYMYLYQRLQLQFYVLLMMGAMDTRNM